MLYACQVYDIERNFIKKIDINYKFKLVDYNTKDKENLWYHNFNNPELEKLIKIAFQHNYSLKTAWQNLSIAQLNAQNAGANLYPSFNTSSNSIYSDNNSTGYTKGLTYSISTNWELDLWGRIKAIRESEKTNYDISQLELINTALLLSTNIAESYYNLVFLIKQGKILKQQIIEAQKVFKILKLRKNLGESSLVSLGQQEQVILSVQRRLNENEQSIALVQNFLQSLLGQVAGQKTFQPKQTKHEIPLINLFHKKTNLFELNPRLQASLKAVERNEFLRAAQLASRFPSFSISANYGITSTAKGFNLFQPISSISSALTKNIWDSGIEKRNYKITKKNVEIALSQLSQNYIETIRELENNLIAEKKMKISYDISKKRLHLAQKNIQIALKEYTSGTIEYISYLNTLNSLFSIELEALQIEQQLFIQRINLYKLIGGNILLLKKEKRKYEK